MTKLLENILTSELRILSSNVYRFYISVSWIVRCPFCLLMVHPQMVNARLLISSLTLPALQLHYRFGKIEFQIFQSRGKCRGMVDTFSCTGRRTCATNYTLLGCCSVWADPC